MTTDTDADNNNGCCRYVPQWQEKLGWKLFPARHVDAPEIPGRTKDCLITKATVHLSFIDRIRVLISGRLLVTTKTATENDIGDTLSDSVAYVEPPRCLERNDTRHSDEG